MTNEFTTQFGWMTKALFSPPYVLRKRHAQDDPFMNKRVISKTVSINDYVAYELSEFGKYVGHLNALTGSDTLLLPNQTTHFINEHL